MKNSVEHIFFDLDHTLWDFEKNSSESLRECYRHFNLAEKSRGQSEDVFIETYLGHNDRLWGLYRQNKITKSRLRKARFERTLQSLRIQDKDLPLKMDALYMSICPRKKELLPGTLDILHHVKDNYHLHILSNGFHETQLIKMNNSGLDKFFLQIITSERAGAKKPDPRIFRFAESITGATTQNSLMIGDNLDVDVKGAVDYGWKAIHFNPGKIDHSFEEVGELLELKKLL